MERLNLPEFFMGSGNWRNTDPEYVRLADAAVINTKALKSLLPNV
ncbi:MAG TPA: hypothetical protein V6C84_25415 [Coleofasciculaceae cyanobacterium]